MNAMLALVDCQRDYLEACSIEPAAGTMIQETARLAERCRAIGVPVAHVWTTVSRENDQRMPHWKQNGVWRCQGGTEGHAPPPALAPRDGDVVFHKAAFSGFTSPGFREHVRDLAVDTLIIAGVHTHACVRQTAIDAHQAGLRVLIAGDATASDDPVHAAITRRYLEARGMAFLSTADLDATLQKPDRLSGSSSVRPLDDVMRSAKDAQVMWARESLKARTALLVRLAGNLAERVDDLAAMMAREIGKPLRFGRVEVLRTVEMLRAVAARAASCTESATDGDVIVRRRPHGVCAVITPWNNPVYIALGKIAPAVAFGNAAVWKPAPQANALSREIMQCIEAASWPRGLVHLLEGDRHIAAKLMADPRIDAVTITGSSDAGYAAQEVCARRRIPLQAELGGNNAAIIWPGADLVDAASQIAAGAFDQAGQRCTANRRVIVHPDCRDHLLQDLACATTELPWGDPRCESTRIGPMVNASHRDRVATAVQRSRDAGHRHLLPLGGTPPQARGIDAPWHPPTIICCDDPAHEIVQEETFGPVLVVQTARDWNHAIELCNGVRQGLAAAIFNSNGSIINRFLNEAQAGILKINQATADAAVDVPFGGWKSSGIGPPEHGAFDLEFFTRPQTIYGDFVLHE